MESVSVRDNFVSSSTTCPFDVEGIGVEGLKADEGMLYKSVQTRNREAASSEEHDVRLAKYTGSRDLRRLYATVGQPGK